MAPSLEEMMRHRRSPRRALLPSTALSQRQKMNLTPTALPSFHAGGSGGLSCTVYRYTIHP